MTSAFPKLLQLIRILWFDVFVHLQRLLAYLASGSSCETKPSAT